MVDPVDPSLEDILSNEEEGMGYRNPSESPAVQDEEDETGLTRDDDVSDWMEEVTGRKPEPGKTIGDIVNQAEEERHRPPRIDDNEE